MSALMTRDTRLPYLPTASVARLTTSNTSSHSPSMVVNIESVWLGSPDSRTIFTASATASWTEPSVEGVLEEPAETGGWPDGATENASNMTPVFHVKSDILRATYR